MGAALIGKNVIAVIPPSSSDLSQSLYRGVCGLWRFEFQSGKKPVTGNHDKAINVLFSRSKILLNRIDSKNHYQLGLASQSHNRVNKNPVNLIGGKWTVLPINE